MALFKNKNEYWLNIAYNGVSPRTMKELAERVNLCLEQEPFVLISVTGNKGIGKSTFGRYVRIHGFENILPKDIAVIDDGCMSAPFAFFFRREYEFPCNGVDELQPFYKYCKKRRVRFYIDATPEQRISRASIVLRLETDEENRRKRLIQRKGEKAGLDLYHRTKNYTNSPDIEYRYEIAGTLA